jgi:hypothetical protein
MPSLEEMAILNANYAMHKMKSMSNHREVINLIRDNMAEEELDEGNES